MNRYRLRRVTPRSSEASLVLNQWICSVTADHAPSSHVDEEPEFVQPGAHGVRCHTEQAGDGPDVLGPNGDHPTVEALTMPRHNAQNPPQGVRPRSTARVKLVQVDGTLLGPRRRQIG